MDEGINGAYGAGLDDFLQCEVHPRIAINEVSVQSFAILELDQHRVALGGVQ